MRHATFVLVSLIAAGLVGCSGPAFGPSANTSPAGLGATAPTRWQTSPADPQMRVGARAAAAHFYKLYSANKFAATWELLTPAAKRQIPKARWVRVHHGCPSTGAGMARVIKAVTAFGNAAIVTEAIAGTLSRLGAVGDVFSLVNRRWGYLPQDVSIYHHGSVADDIAAARAAGYCAGKRVSPL